MVYKVKRINHQSAKVIDKYEHLPDYNDEKTLKDDMLILNALHMEKDKHRVQDIMIKTFKYRRSLGEQILTKFPRFLDIPYLVTFCLLQSHTHSKFLHQSILADSIRLRTNVSRS